MLSLAAGLALAVQLAACGGAPPDETPQPPEPEAVANWRMVDLTHAYGGDTLYWPTDTTGFRLETLAEGQTAGGYFYAAKQFATAEHGGTHLDAPFHFAQGGSTSRVDSPGKAHSPGHRAGRQPVGGGRSRLPGHPR